MRLIVLLCELWKVESGCVGILVGLCTWWLLVNPPLTLINGPYHSFMTQGISSQHYTLSSKNIP